MFPTANLSGLSFPGGNDSPVDVVGTYEGCPVIEFNGNSGHPQNISLRHRGCVIFLKAGPLRLPPLTQAKRGFYVYVLNKNTLALQVSAQSVDSFESFLSTEKVSPNTLSVITANLKSDGTLCWQCDVVHTAGGNLQTLYGNSICQSTGPGANGSGFGYAAAPSGSESTSLGSYTSASGASSTAIGMSATASGSKSVAIGKDTSASTTGAIAIGSNSAGTASMATSNNGACAIGGSYASGADSFAAAVANNTSTYGAKATNAIAIGQQANVTAIYGIGIGGSSASSTGQGAIAIGGSNYGAISSGYETLAIGNGAKAVEAGKFARSCNPFANSGDAQAGMFVLRVSTINATPSPITSDGNSAATTNQVILPNDSTFFFRAKVVARRTDADNESAAYIFEGCVDRNASAATTALVGAVSKTVLAEDTAAWDVAVTADTTNGGLTFTVTGEAAKTIRWVAVVETVEVTG